VFQTFDWAHGVYAAATMGSEATAAAESGLPAIRRDPMAMLPFCGYHVADYFAHWLALGSALAHPPPVFRVNWFRRGDDQRFLWPGFGDNARVLVWMVERAHGRGGAVPSPYGWVPRYDDLAVAGLGVSEPEFGRLMHVELAGATAEAESHDELFAPLLGRLPAELVKQRDELRQRLQDAAESGPRAAAFALPTPVEPRVA
jgi:phosphoenolpyruvate carboxykinase (GTP)